MRDPVNKQEEEEAEAELEVKVVVAVEVEVGHLHPAQLCHVNIRAALSRVPRGVSLQLIPGLAALDRC